MHFIFCEVYLHLTATGLNAINRRKLVPGNDLIITSRRESFLNGCFTDTVRKKFLSKSCYLYIIRSGVERGVENLFFLFSRIPVYISKIL